LTFRASDCFATIGFVRPGQPVKVKLAAYPFQKCDMVDGVVEHVGAAALDTAAQEAGAANAKRPAARPLTYKALVLLKAMSPSVGGERLDPGAGMQATAEVSRGHWCGKAGARRAGAARVG
jgi:HlyD family secretion protein